MKNLLIVLVLLAIMPLGYSESVSFTELLVISGKLEHSPGYSGSDCGVEEKPSFFGKFFSFYRIPKNPMTSASVVSSTGFETHQIRFYGKDGAEVRVLRIGWNPRFIDEHLLSSSFNFFVVPYTFIEKIELVINEKVHDTVRVSKNIPEFLDFSETLNFSKQQESPESVSLEWTSNENPLEIKDLKQTFNYSKNKGCPDSVLLEWNSGDQDNVLAGWDIDDPLLRMNHYIFYSHNNGQTWSILNFNIKDLKKLVSVDGLRGGNKCRLMVGVSDGFHQAYGVTAPFKVKDLPIKVDITLPNYPHYLHKAGVVFGSQVYDLQHRKHVNKKRLIWTSDKDGVIKKGKGRFVFRNLSIGRHKITLSVEGSDMKDEVTVIIDPRK